MKKCMAIGCSHVTHGKTDVEMLTNEANHMEHVHGCRVEREYSKGILILVTVFPPPQRKHTQRCIISQGESGQHYDKKLKFLETCCWCHK